MKSQCLALLAVVIILPCAGAVTEKGVIVKITPDTFVVLTTKGEELNLTPAKSVIDGQSLSTHRFGELEVGQRVTVDWHFDKETWIPTCRCVRIMDPPRNGEPDTAKSEKERLQGKWKITSLHLPVGEMSMKEDCYLVFEGDKLTMTIKQLNVRTTGDFVIGLSDHPKRLDVVDPGDQKIKRLEMLYELKRDTLKLAMPADLKLTRPKSMEVTKDGNVAVMMCERVKEKNGNEKKEKKEKE
jgi:uncharacterized protein (TIGR03067 family)